MLFFRSEEHLEHWLQSSTRPRGAVMSLAETWTLSRAWYPDRRKPEWRPRTIDESQSLLTRIGHAAEFWQLKRG